MNLETQAPVAAAGTDDPADWLRLSATAGVGPETARRLLAAFGLPAAVFAQSFSALAAIVSERVARALLDKPSPKAQAAIDNTLAWMTQPGNSLLTLADPTYPRALLDIPDPPILLYAKGRIELLQAESIGVVGSRNATVQGITNAERFAESLAAAGLTIVSGMALGIDSAAHAGALRHVQGSTVAVIGTGCDIVYPARNRSLAHRIAEAGCIVSEYAIGTPAIAANFPRRNRIISGLSRGVLVVEAALPSGSLITARTAADQGRDVFAIPGSIHSPLSKGCHQLIKQGAKLVESAQDILEEYDLRQQTLMPESNGAMHAACGDDALLRTIGFDPVALDVLTGRTGAAIGEVQAQLLMLELAGRIEMLPGNMVRRLD